MGHTRALSIDSVTVTGDYNHGAYVEWLPGSAGHGRTSAHVSIPPVSTEVNTWEGSGTATEVYTCPRVLKVGKTVDAISVVWRANGAAGTKYFRVYEQDVGTLTPTDKAASVTSTSTSSTVAELAVVTTPFVVTAANSYAFHFTGAGGSEQIVAIKVTYSES
jgi:hypothetical protein